MLIAMVNLLYSIFCNTGKIWYDVIPSIKERRIVWRHLIR